jgi:hypothetical protein
LLIVNGLCGVDGTALVSPAGDSDLASSLVAAKLHPGDEISPSEAGDADKPVVENSEELKPSLLCF